MNFVEDGCRHNRVGKRASGLPNGSPMKPRDDDPGVGCGVGRRPGRGGRIRPLVVIIKALASSINIGSGGSVGREGPIVQIGTALGSTIGQWMHQSERRIRTLVACGAAAGIAATSTPPSPG